MISCQTLIKDSVAEIEKCVESDHCGIGNDPDIMDDNNQPSDSTQTRVCYVDEAYVYVCQSAVSHDRQS